MGCGASKQVDPTQPDPGPIQRPKAEVGAGARDTETPAPRPPHFGPEALLASVESGAIAALRGRWLVDLEARGGRVQRRQDLPPEAFFPANELRRLVEALGDDYADDGAWWKSTVSRGGRSDVARVVWTIEGAKAACDVTLTMLNRRAERESGLGWTRFAPPSLAHAALGTSMWTAFAVDCSLPTTRGGGRSALVSLMRDVDAAADGASAAKVEKKS